MVRMNIPHRLIYLNTLSLVGGTDWKGSGGVSLLDDVYHWGRPKIIKGLCHFLYSHSLLVVVYKVIFQLLVQPPAASYLCSTSMDSKDLKP